MCPDCNKKDCCCEENRINVAGKKGDQGPKGSNGVSSYVYVGYATNVTPGTPDTVIGFSTTTPQCWVAIKTSVTPLTVTSATFQGLWKKVCGADGNDGDSAFLYIAYASNVVAGTPDTVTGFSLTTPQCWMASIASTTPLTPVQTDFQGKWKKICGADGAGSTPVNIYAEAGLGTLAINNGNGNLNTDIVIATAAAATVAGTYVIHGLLPYINVWYPTSTATAGNLVLKLKVNGSTVKFIYFGLNSLVGSAEVGLTLFVRTSLVIGDIVTLTLALESDVSGAMDEYVQTYLIAPAGVTATIVGQKIS